MKFEIRQSTLIFTSVLALLVMFAALQAAASDRVGSRAIEIDGVTYSGDITDAELRRVAADFETVRTAIRDLDPKRNIAFPYPVQVVAVGSAARLQQFAKADSFLAEGILAKFIVFRHGDVAARRESLRLFAGLILDNAFGPLALPAWLRTGLMRSFSTFEPRRGSAQRLRTERSISVSPSVQILLETDNYTLNRQNPETSAGYERRSTSLVRTFLATRPAGLPEFCRLIESGRPQLAAIKSAFGFASDTLESAAAAEFGPLEIEIREIPDSETVAIGPVETELTDAAILIAANSAARVGTLLSDKRPTAYSLTLSALVAEAQGQLTEAESLFQRAMVIDPRDYRPRFALAATQIAREATEYGLLSGVPLETAERIRANLKKSIDSAPRFGDAYELLALVNSVRGENISESIDLMKTPLSIAPGNSWYRMRLAELQIADRNFAPAMRIVRALSRTAGDDRMRVYAESTLTRATSLEAQLRSLKDRSIREIDGVTDTPMSDEELARRRAKALNESLNLALRIPATDEARIIGTIERVECSSGRVDVDVRSADGLVRLRTTSVENVILTSFVDKLVNTTFGCGAGRSSSPAVVTFRRGDDRTVAEIVAIEFVPPGFRFL